MRPNDWWNKPSWGDVLATTLREAGDTLDQELAATCQVMSEQSRPAHKIKIWKALMELGPERGQDLQWDARREMFLESALMGARSNQVVRTLALMARAPRIEEPGRLRSSLSYCLGAAQEGRQRRQVVRESLQGLMIQVASSMDKMPEVALGGLNVIIDVADQHDLKLPWVGWWAQVRMQMGGGQHDDQLLAQLVDLGVDLNACDQLETPLLEWLGGQRQNSQVVWAIEAALTAGLDWSRTPKLTSFVQAVVDGHPVVRRTLLSAHIQDTGEAGTGKPRRGRTL